MKKQLLNELHEKMLISSRESFDKDTDDMVYGEGDLDARLMLIGEAPGAEETKLKRPFVGKAGKNLDGFLEVIGHKRESIYISNVVKFRPFKVSAKGTKSNKTPNAKELRVFVELLKQEINILKPKVIVTLGNTPLKAVTGDKTKRIGAVHAVAERMNTHEHEFFIFPLYHPASIIYNRALKETYLQDLHELSEYLKEI